jgi:thiol-disulfide isomerase/thioredoxin
MMSRILFFIFILSIFACSKDDGKTSQVETKQESKPTASELAAIDVSLLDADGFQALINQHRGKLLFINTWATWCVPCKEEFPDLVRLQEYYDDSDVVLVGISVDFPDEIESKVKPFLYSQKVKFPNYVQNFKQQEDLINLLNEKWRGAVPATFIYDREGNQQKFLLGKHSFDDFKFEIENVRSSQ